MERTLNILSLDAATEYSGYLVVKNGKPVEWNILRAVGVDVWDRIVDYSDKLYELLSVHNVDVFGYEYPAGGASYSVSLKLGALMYQSIVTFRHYKLLWIPEGKEMVFVNPSHVKATGAHKNAMEFAGEQAGITFHWKSKAEKKRLGNVADAIGIWLWLKENGYG